MDTRIMDELLAILDDERLTLGQVAERWAEITGVEAGVYRAEFAAAGLYASSPDGADRPIG